MTAPRLLRAVVLAVLAAGALAALACVYAFSQSRFFTIDEYQYGHATWLVSQGFVPYRDFFEHHFPLSYVLHAPLLGFGGDFPSQALLLRKIVFASLAAAAAVSAWTCWRVTGNAFAAWTTLALPPVFGFSLMSAVDYRADCFGAFYFIACLSLLEWNRERDSRALALLCGVLAFVAAWMTQKLAFVAGVTLAAMWASDRLLQAVRAGGQAAPYLRRPLAVAGAGALATAALLAAGAASGALVAGWEATVELAVRHEQLYQPFSLFERGYVTPFLEETWATTFPIAAFAIGFLATPRGRFWLFPLLAAALGSAWVAAPYPYNFVLPCWLVAMLGVRGFAGTLAWLAERAPRVRTLLPLAWLLPALACLDQLAFVSGTTTNAHQLEILARIERFGEPTDAVIDNAGGAMFSPHASHYYYHGDAHRQVFADYFENQLVEDYRKSGALFWIRDLRSESLPRAVQDYLANHYVSGGGNLFTLGFLFPEGGEAPIHGRIDLVRAGEYHLNLAGPPRPNDRLHDLVIDGRPVSSRRVMLTAGPHDVTVLPGSPAYVISLVPGAFFDFEPSAHPYSMLFEYRDSDERMLSFPAERKPRL